MTVTTCILSGSFKERRLDLVMFILHCLRSIQQLFPEMQPQGGMNRSTTTRAVNVSVEVVPPNITERKISNTSSTRA